LNFGGYKNGRAVARKLEKANIIADSGVRLGVNEVTHRGMRKVEMQKIAEFIERAYKKNENPLQIKKEVIKFMKDFQEVQFCFK
jgi:glycine hydroxymethyltransferase